MGFNKKLSSTNTRKGLYSYREFHLKNICTNRIGLPFLFLFAFQFYSGALAQEDILRFAWTPNTETYLSHYVIYRDTKPGTMKMLDNVSKSDSTYKDDTVLPGVIYYYKLTAADSNGYESEPSNEVLAYIDKVPGPGNDDSDIVIVSALRQNYPNPFNSNTTIVYSIQNSSWVNITVFDALGQKIRTLENSFKEAGNYQVEWDGKNNQGAEVATGIYYYKLLAETLVNTKKLMFNK